MNKVVSSDGPVAAPRINRTARGMTTEAVLAAATDILERDGLLGLSMRTLATELGVSTSTVYWHVGTRDELLDKLIEQITDQLGNVQPEGRGPAARIGSIVRSLLNEVRARPQLISLSATRGRGEAIFTKAQVALRPRRGRRLRPLHHPVPSGRVRSFGALVVARLSRARRDAMGRGGPRARPGHERQPPPRRGPGPGIRLHPRGHPRRPARRRLTRAGTPAFTVSLRPPGSARWAARFDRDP
jgi:AcrR family transcriptional regulator